MALFTHLSDWDGAYVVDANAGRADTDLLGEPRVAAAAWYQVQEAELVGVDGVFYQYSPTLVLYDEAVDAPGTIEVAVEDDTLRGAFAFSASNVSGRFRADTCDNEALYNEALRRFQAMGDVPP